MKNLLFLATLLTVFMACKNNNNPTNTDEIIVEEELDELPNETDLDLEMALAAFRKKDFETTAKYITTAIDDLRKESIVGDQNPNEELEATITSMHSLANRITSGKVVTEADLQEVFAHVDMLLAHQYLLLSMMYDQQFPAKRKGVIENAEERMKKAAKKTNGKAKNEINSIRSNIKKDLADGDKKVDKLGNKAGKKVTQLEKWIDEHAKKMGIKPKPAEE